MQTLANGMMTRRFCMTSKSPLDGNRKYESWERCRVPRPCVFCKGGYDAADSTGSKPACLSPSSQNHSVAVRYPPFATCAKNGAPATVAASAILRLVVPRLRPLHLRKPGERPVCPQVSRSNALSRLAAHHFTPIHVARMCDSDKKSCLL